MVVALRDGGLPLDRGRASSLTSWSNSRPAVRWWILLKVQGIHLSIARVAGLFLIGMFYNQFLPGGTGGDIMKSYLLLKETPGKATGALLAVVFDRMVGLVALISITGVLIALRYEWLTQTAGDDSISSGCCLRFSAARS